MAALVLALGAELLSAFGPESVQWLGMVLAVAAVALAGLSTYIKGFNAASRAPRVCPNARMQRARSFMPISPMSSTRCGCGTS